MKAEDRKYQIMYEAARLFSEYGYEKTSISMICSSLKIGRGTIYQYFKDKNDIFRVTIENYLNEFKNKIIQKSKQAENESININQIMTNVVTFVCNEADKNKNIYRIILKESRAMNPQVTDLFENFIDTLIEFFKGKIEYYTKKGVISVDNMYFASVSHVIYMLGIIEWNIFKNEYNVNELIENIMGFYYKPIFYNS